MEEFKTQSKMESHRCCVVTEDVRESVGRRVADGYVILEALGRGRKQVGKLKVEEPQI